MLLYWAESVIIGLLNVIKRVVVGRWIALFYAPFFLAHYGAFMAVHMLFVFMFFLRGQGTGSDVQVDDLGRHVRVMAGPARPRRQPCAVVRAEFHRAARIHRRPSSRNR